jgi:RNA polymerase sigma-70 factor, ECF subfamily
MNAAGPGTIAEVQMSEKPKNGPLDPSDGEEDSGEVVRRIQDYLDQLRKRVEPQPVNTEEWNRFFQFHTSFFQRLVRGRHWSPEDREDNVQELWLLFISRLPELQFESCRGRLRDWVSAVATHRLADQNRYRKNHSIGRLASEAADQLAGREPDPTDTFERIQLKDLVRKALAELRSQVSQRDYDAFTLRWLEGLSVREVADRLGMTAGQVRTSNHRAGMRLRPLLVRRLHPGFDSKRDG